ncbi:resistance protein [Striga asiatica]|uniref:Resistance protein n=1 Tax=Striga asiatica TaxID=4170 RepID=A0A5A7PS60_STRAF|nr:resistance protein [Striga asiatica]
MKNKPYARSYIIANSFSIHKIRRRGAKPAAARRNGGHGVRREVQRREERVRSGAGGLTRRGGNLVAALGFCTARGLEGLGASRREGRSGAARETCPSEGPLRVSRREGPARRKPKTLVNPIKHLLVSGMPKIKQVGTEFYGTGTIVTPFPKLENLTFNHIPVWRKWTGPTGSSCGNIEFPNLQGLSFVRCGKLAEVSPLTFPALRTLDVEQ